MTEHAADAAQLEALGITPLPELDATRADLAPQLRLESTRRAAAQYRETLLSGPQARYDQTLDLIRVPYPTRFGLLNATTVKSPFMHILNRLFVVQFDSPTGLKTMLFSPSDIDANRETPFFKNLAESMPKLGRDRLMNALGPTLDTVETALARTGITPEQVDYISYDHLHTQDVRKWLGDATTPGYFPNAKLLVMREEWCSTQALLPPQSYWYCPNGIAGIPADRVVLLSTSVQLGDGVALVRTPGHTEGNHSLAVHTPEGVLVSSENGVSADSFAPEHSQIPGVADYARRTGQEIILNGNTLERGLDQYISMVMEKTLAGPSARDARFNNVVPSSELTAYWAFPGLKPTFSFGQLKFGEPVTG